MEVCKLFKSKFVNQRVVEQTYRLFKQCTDEEKKWMKIEEFIDLG